METFKSSSIPTVESIKADMVDLVRDFDTIWVMFGTAAVFLMQVGFAMVEVGSVSMKNSKNILMKNIGGACLGAIGWWTLGHGFGFGEDSGGFIGIRTHFVLKGSAFRSEDGTLTNGYNYALWLFRWTFAVTASTIVSGAVAERFHFLPFISFSVLLTSFIYPVVAHWAWSGGWASTSVEEGELLFGCGLLDFAGSGVVHAVGGLAALCACLVVGPRVGRFNSDGTFNTLPQQSAVLQTLGVLIMWFGWQGFNGVSTYTLSGGGSGVAAKAMVTTTISAGSGAITNIVLKKKNMGYWDSGAATSGVLAGLVGISAGCSTVEPEGAMIIGILASVIYSRSSSLLLKLKIDDVVDAVPIHLCCGLWGIIAASLFATKDNYAAVYGGDRAGSCAGVFYGGNGSTLGAGVVFILASMAWTFATSMLFFVPTKLTAGVRASREGEEAGMDAVDHGGLTYPELSLTNTTQQQNNVLRRKHQK